ncbi:MAG: hypothetical protein LBQ64_04105 [Bacteroidales bacterium]|jgi:hypothetical protein|nr:hypothetical protein [Bacteroidales bacterium]
MKKTIKIAGITLLSITGVIIIALITVFWLLVTPERLTPIVRQQAQNYISCQTQLETVDLTLFKTFPDIGIRIRNLQLINPVAGFSFDTLLSVEECIVSFNIKKILTDQTFIIHNFYLKNGSANLFTDSAGNSNYDVFVFDTTNKEDNSFAINGIDLHKITIEDVNLQYINRQAKIQTELSHLNLLAKGDMTGNDITGSLSLKTDHASFHLYDSTSIKASTGGISVDLKGKMKEWDVITGNVQLSLADVSLDAGDMSYLQSRQISFNSPLDLHLINQYLTLNKSEIALDEHNIQLSGTVSRDTGNADIAVNVSFATNSWDIQKTLDLVPASFKTPLEGMEMEGILLLSGKANGIYNSSSIPLIQADIYCEKGKFAMDSLPYTFSDINAAINASIDLNNNISGVKVHHFSAATGNSKVKCSGTVDDLFNTMLCNLKAEAHLNLPELHAVLPAEIQAKGLADASLTATFTLDQLTKMLLEQMKMTANVRLTNLDVMYNDSIKIQSAAAQIDLKLPSGSSGKQSFKKLLHADINSADVKVDMLDFLSADMQDVRLNIDLSDFRDTTKLLSMACDFDFDRFRVEMDTLSADITKPSGTFTLQPSGKNAKNPAVACSYANEELAVKMGNSLSAVTKQIRLEGDVEYDDLQKDMLLQWHPNLKINLQQGTLNTDMFPETINIPVIRFNFTPGRFNIRESRVLVGNSDFKVSGLITNIDNYLKDTGLLKGELTIVSEQADVYQLMDYINGLGHTDDPTSAAEELENKEDNPFIVPLGVDITLLTQVKKAIAGETLLQNLHGQLTVKDGILVLEEMGFTSDAAKMQLTAIYRSPRKNHLFAGIDFHLLDIDIARLIAMFPDIDTIIPTLKSFAGKAEFHFAIETYLKSNYDLKLSTLRGAAAISGQDLVLMDSKSFATIAKKLMFKKKTENKVDSISAELTIYKNEIDLYPFMIAMDKYKAVVSGRYNLDKTGEYHISIVETPLPIRLGLRIRDDSEKMKFNIVRCQYARLFRPKKQGVVENKIMELKSIISSSLKANVKQQE